jgi:aldose 1-epimerase
MAAMTLSSSGTPLSGTQVTLSAGGYRASIASIGASVRSLQFEGRDLIVPFDEDSIRPVYRGATLVPWPNRVVDGTYELDGEVQQLGLTEPARGHALHGLAGWRDYEVREQSESSATLFVTIPAQLGYPRRLDIAVTFTLSDAGLHTTVTATNTGRGTAPFGTAPHPYLKAGDGLVNDWTLSLPADEVLTVTEDRLIPTGRASVTEADGGVYDFRTAHRIDDTFIDHAFTGLGRDAEGNTEVRLTAADGSGVVMRWGAECPWVQVHTADRPEPEMNRVGLAVEPMTCPPDAYNSGDDLILIEPGESASASWTIAAIQ